MIVVVVAGLSYEANNFLMVHDPPSSLISAEPSLGDWPMYQRDPTHSGFTSDVSFRPEGNINWVFETDGQIVTSPVVVDGAVYLSAVRQSDQQILALDADTGKLLWEYSASAPIDSSLAVAGGLVFVTMRNGRLLALNSSDGTINWGFDAGAPLYGSPTVYRGTVYIGTLGKEIYAIDAATGSLLWDQKVGGSITSNPVANDQIIAISARDNIVYILDARTGKIRLDYRTSETLGSIAIGGERVYFADTRGALSAIDWTKIRFPLEKKFRAVRVHLFGFGLINTFPTRKASVWKVRRQSERFVGTPAVADGMVYVTSSSGKLFKFEELDGNPVWTFDAGVTASDSVSVTPDYVLLGDAKGRVHVIDVDTGESKQQFEVDGPIISTPVITDDMLYVATVDGKLYAIQ